MWSDTLNYSCACLWSCRCRSRAVKGLPSISSLCAGFLVIVLIAVLKEQYFSPYLFLPFCFVFFPFQNLLTIRKFGHSSYFLDVKRIIKWNRIRRQLLKCSCSLWFSGNRIKGKKNHQNLLFLNGANCLSKKFISSKTSPEALVHRNAHSSRSLSYRKQAHILKENI